MIDRELSQFVLRLLERKDPDKVAYEIMIHKSMKQTAMSKTFHNANEEEDNAQMIELMEQMNKTEGQIRKAMEQHMQLIDSMAQSMKIKEIEKH